MNIAKILKKRRKQLSISQATLAEYVGFKHKSSIHRFETGKIEWKFRDVVLACEILKINIKLTNIEDESII